jgi:hypothetical protein
MLPHLRRLSPFVLEGESVFPGFVIEDLLFFETSPGQTPRLNRALWKSAPSTKSKRDGLVYLGGIPLVIYVAEMGQSEDSLPLAYIYDEQNQPDEPPVIEWNSVKDLTFSKLTHISNQAFYLRRYARRVAALWQQEYGRHPIIKAKTAVSFNGRPYQELVDPEADLASVPVKWFGHNSWVKDLEVRRVPREVLSNGSQFVGP